MKTKVAYDTYNRIDEAINKVIDEIHSEGGKVKDIKLTSIGQHHYTLCAVVLYEEVTMPAAEKIDWVPEFYKDSYQYHYIPVPQEYNPQYVSDYTTILSQEIQ